MSCHNNVNQIYGKGFLGFHTGFTVWGGGGGGERIFSEIFPEVYNLAKILLALPVGTATIERSFSHMKMIKTRLRNRLSDENLTHLMRIAIEDPDLSEVNLNEILDIFKEKICALDCNWYIILL